MLQRPIKQKTMNTNGENKPHKRLKICFVALTAYPFLSEKEPKYVVGPTVFQILLAQELIKHNIEVSFITYDNGGSSTEERGGIEILKTYEEGSRLHKIQKAFRIWKAMKKCGAHVYLNRGSLPGAVSLLCRLIKKKFILLISSDALVNRELITKKNKEFTRSLFSRATFGYWLDIKLADSIVVQNEYQKEMLKKNFGKEGILIKKPMPLTERGVLEKAEPSIVLWVGAMAEVKQPELFLKLAEAIPEAQFQMIGGHTAENQGLYDRMKERSQSVPNFEFLGAIPFHAINDYFSRAAILVNTSLFEAYPPYAFIQAWMNYTPVVSLNDNSDEILCRENIGLHSKTFDQLAKDVKELLGNDMLREEMGVKGKEYVEREHEITRIVHEYIELFNSMDEG